MSSEDHPADWEAEKLKAHGLDTAPAKAAMLPYHSGDGYSFGGGAILTIGEFAIPIGEADGSFALAKEIARRWNTAI